MQLGARGEMWRSNNDLTTSENATSRPRISKKQAKQHAFLPLPHLLGAQFSKIKLMPHTRRNAKRAYFPYI